MTKPPTLAAALVAFQARVKAIPRSRTVSVRTKGGGQYTFSYAPLESIIASVSDDLSACGLAVTQALTQHEGQMALRTTLVHESGERDENQCLLPVSPGMTPQEIGSVITYMRRYAYTAVLGLATEDDDDGNLASGNEASIDRDRAQLADEELLAKLRKFADEHAVDLSAVAASLGYSVESLTVEQALEVGRAIKRAAADSTQR